MKSLLPGLLMAMLLGCDFSSSLLTEEERQSIYSLELSNGLLPLADGAALLPGAELGISVETSGGAARPLALELDLHDASGRPLAELDYAERGSPRAASEPEGEAGAVAVEALDGRLPPFALPAGLPPGLYRLESRFIGRSGSTLQVGEFSFFVAPRDFGLRALSVYPPSPRAGSKSLLMASLEGETEGAWLRWSFEDRVFAEGSAASGFDRVVWTAPSLGGAYGLKVELYPAAPAGGSYGLPSPWSQGVTLIATVPGAAPPDPFDRPERFHSLLSMDGDFLDSGNRAQTAAVEVFGSPRLESYQGGFGYRLGAEAGLRVPGLALPLQAESLSLLLRASLEPGEGGRLLLLRDAEGEPLLELSAREGGLRLSLRGEAGERLLDPGLVFGPGAHDLMLSFRRPPAAREGQYALAWTLDGERSLQRDLVGLRLPELSELALGGGGSAELIVDGVGISLDGPEGIPPLLAASLGRAYGPELLLAEGFESGIPTAAALRGGASLELGGLVLGPDSGLALPLALDPAQPLLVELRHSGGARLLLTGPGGLVLAELREDGSLVDGAGDRLGGLAQAAGRSSFVLRRGASRLEILDPEGRPAASLALSSAMGEPGLEIRAPQGALLRGLLLRRLPGLAAARL